MAKRATEMQKNFDALAGELTSNRDRRRAYSLSAPDWLALLFALALATCLFIATESAYFGDATTYAANVISGKLIEPGHLLWRPVGRLVYEVLGSRSSYSSVLWELQFVCLVASLCCVAAIYQLIRPLYGKGIAIIISVLMLMSNGFLAYSFSGCSYTLSILFIIFSLHYAIGVKDARAIRRAAFISGVFAGLAASSWAIQVLSAPAIWLALLALPRAQSNSTLDRIKSTALFAGGYALVFIVPLVLAYFIAHLYTGVHSPPADTTRSFASWLAASRHGIPAYFGVAQVLRVAIGWPQSIISTFDIGSELRLWHFGERPFPLSAALLVFVAFYSALLAGVAVLLRNWKSNLTGRDRAIVLAGAVGILINLLFAAAWQGTDLERYFPSLAFQLLIVAAILKSIAVKRPRGPIFACAAILLAGLFAVNWLGSFQPLLGPTSVRQGWLRQLKRVATAKDLVITFGQRTDDAVILAPHDPDMPKVDNLSNQIVDRGANWREGIIPDIIQTEKRGGRVMIADSVFWEGNAPREGWSFKEYPKPTPKEIYDTFARFKSHTLAFTVDGEKVWFARLSGG